jgi:hypothetical protein
LGCALIRSSSASALAQAIASSRNMERDAFNICRNRWSSTGSI